MANLATLILAAGQGTRMKSKTPKVLHPLAGRPMLSYVLDLARQVNSDRILLVLGHQATQVQEAMGDALKDVEVLLQREQLGTGHAVLQARSGLSRHSGSVLVLCSDTPLLTGATVGSLLKAHWETDAALTLLSAEVSDPKGYGRVLRGLEGEVQAIVEDRDASPMERRLREVNTGVYAFKAAFLFKALSKVKPGNVQGELYLTDVVRLASEDRIRVGAVSASRPEEVLGINTRVELARAEKILRRRIGERLMLDGITILDPERTIVDATVSVGRDTVIYPGAVLEGNTRIGSGCVLHANVHITDSLLEDDVVVRDASVIADSKVRKGAAVGPFAHLRPGTVVGERARIGNFVEIKNSSVGARTKAGHLTYLGDAEVGRDVNIGAGTITCNYDGKQKHKTVIKDGVFVGSDTQFVAPVSVGDGALIAAGTTVTRDVSPGALAISRTPQVNKEDWARLRRSGKKGEEIKEMAPPSRRQPIPFDALTRREVLERFERFVQTFEANFYKEMEEIISEIPSARKDRTEAFVSFVRQLGSLYQSLATPDLLRRILDETRFLQWLQQEHPKADTEAWVEDLKNLLAPTDRP